MSFPEAHFRRHLVLGTEPDNSGSPNFICCNDAEDVILITVAVNFLPVPINQLGHFHGDRLLVEGTSVTVALLQRSNCIRELKAS